MNETKRCSMAETWIKSNYIYRGRVFSVRVGEVRLSNGKVAPRDIVEHLGGVAIIPMLEDQSIIFARQFRIPIEQETLELPGGRLELGDTIEKRVIAELEEEVGYKAKSIVSIANYFPSAGFSNEKRHIFWAYGLERTRRKLDWDENIDLEILPLIRVKEKLFNGDFQDANTIIGLYGLLTYFEKNGIA